VSPNSLMKCWRQPSRCARIREAAAHTGPPPRNYYVLDHYSLRMRRQIPFVLEVVVGTRVLDDDA
jgi:hypothetical protein